jgi:hypothetical protein
MTMPITHVNAKGKTYYLHQGVTKTGKPKYYFSLKNTGTLATAIPAGFEIYETPNAQVLLRKIPPKLITDEERQLVEAGMRQYSDVHDYKIDVKGNAIVIYTADQDADEFSNRLKGLNPVISETKIREFFASLAHYSPMLQFNLENSERRVFSAQRYCFLGSIDDWIYIGHGELATLVKTYLKHLGKDSYFELF